MFCHHQDLRIMFLVSLNPSIFYELFLFLQQIGLLTFLQHYNSLLELRKRLITAPHKALTLSEASRKLCVSEGYFRSVYRECFGISYNQDSINARLMKACFLLLTTAMSIYSVALNCGYSDEKFFARQFRKFKGCSPMEYRKKVADTL